MAFSLMVKNMPNNIIVQLDTQDDERALEVENRIKNLYNVTPLSANSWFLNVEYTSEQLVRHLADALTDSDTLVVIDASNDNISWFNIDDKRATRIQQHWKM